MQSSKIYEVYVYCDPRYIGPYRYGNYCFSYKPIYVGKGSQKWKRKYVHLNKSSNRRLKNAITALKRGSLRPIIVTICKAVSEHKSIVIEKELIQTIGREDIGSGILYNLTNGGEGQSGRFFSELERKKKIAKYQKLFCEFIA